MRYPRRSTPENRLRLNTKDVAMRSGVFVALIVLFKLTSAAEISIAEESSKLMAVATLINQIKSSSSSERVSLAFKLEDLLWHMDRVELDVISLDLIDEIESMLSDSNEGVIYAAASALGHIGKPASHTIPALLKALKEVEAGHSHGPVRPGGMGADDAIVSALIKLKACVPPPKHFDTSACDYLLR
jgi:hypothetical protein